MAPFREPARARAASALYRDFIVPLFPRVIRGMYRRRLATPTLLLYGSDDPNMWPELLGGYEGLADDLVIESIDGASHFVADEQPDAVTEVILTALRSVS